MDLDPTRDDPRASDRSAFPDPTYKETVLRPLFDGAKAHHVAGFRRIDRAHLVMLAETGILRGEDARAIAGALEAIDRDLDVPSLTYTGEVEDFFFLIEKELRRRIGPEVAGRLHTGRSRNDIDHTLFKLALKERIDALGARLRGFVDALLATAERERGTLIVAYTHGQPAQPDTFGHYLAAVAEFVLRDLERLMAARRIVDLSPMGAAAITTSGFPLDRHRMAELLGFAAPLENSYGCIASVDYVTATYSAIELTFLHLGRPIQDLQFWTSFEVGQIYVPNAFVQISSIMPQKRNPVPIEHLRHLASQTVGRARAMLDIVHNTPFTDMNDSEGETHEMGYGAFASAFRVLDLLTALVPALRVDPRRVAENIRKSCITVTELADSLVRIEGLSFREAHEIASTVARAVVAADGSLPGDGYAPFVAAFAHAAGRPPGIDAGRFAEIVSPEHFVAVRGRFGGPAPEALQASLLRYRDRLDAFEREAKGHAAREAGSARELAERFAALAGEP
ncbi:MAG TPA: argininosuccinate lyase [Microvirga sp.]|nr:argininosuccinate lyase [Microvirga sp.]